jgi:hypothetical protein
MIPAEVVDAVSDKFSHLDITKGDIDRIIEAAESHMLAELRSHITRQILAANNNEGFTEFAAGWVAALKNVMQALPGDTK